MTTHTSWSFRDMATGQVTGRVYTGPVDMLEANTPPGCEPLIGIWPTEAEQARAALLAARDDAEPPA